MEAEEIEEGFKIKIHDCKNNTTIFNTDKWIKLEDVSKIIYALKAKMNEKEKVCGYDNCFELRLSMSVFCEKHRYAIEL